MKFGMLMYPDDLPLADIVTDGYCRHFMTLSFPSNCPLAWILVLRADSIFFNADVSIWLTLNLLMRMGITIRPSIRSTHFQACAFADKSHERNGTKVGMLMYADDLPSADINADGHCCHFTHMSLQLSVSLGFSIATKSLWRKSLHFGMLMYPDDLPSDYRRLCVL